MLSPLHISFRMIAWVYLSCYSTCVLWSLCPRRDSFVFVAIRCIRVHHVVPHRYRIMRYVLSLDSSGQSAGGTRLIVGANASHGEFITSEQGRGVSWIRLPPLHPVERCPILLDIVSTHNPISRSCWSALTRKGTQTRTRSTWLTSLANPLHESHRYPRPPIVRHHCRDRIGRTRPIPIVHHPQLLPFILQVA